MPMAPQGSGAPQGPGPQGPQGPGPQGAPQGEGQEAPPVVQLVKNVGQGLSTIVELLGKAGAPEEAIGAFESALDAFGQGLSVLSGGGAGPSGPATSTPEAGGRPGAAPANPGMMRR